MNNKKQAELMRLQHQLNTRADFLNAKENALKRKELALQQGIAPTTGPQTLKQNLGNAFDPAMRPGNVGDINKVIWPFFFTTESIIIDINTTSRTGFTITQEAAFIWMSYTKTVYSVAGGTDFTYVDPDDSTVAGTSRFLSFTIRDSSSGRDYQNLPIDLDATGNPRWPTKLPRPLLFLPNQNVEISFVNSSTTPGDVFAPFITAFGYRIRIEDAQNILSTIFV